jgi:SNF2 family DNA or RNA helicase
MLKLEDLNKDAQIEGLDPNGIVRVVTCEPVGTDALTVYYQAADGSMLPRQPLRYVLADDPGAGKTIMAGLFIPELLMRADARRVLIVAPGSLSERVQHAIFYLCRPVVCTLLRVHSVRSREIIRHS